MPSLLSPQVRSQLRGLCRHQPPRPPRLVASAGGACPIQGAGRRAEGPDSSPCSTPRLLTLTAYNLLPFCPRYTFPKAPRLMGFTMVNSSMEGGLGIEILFRHFPAAAPLPLSSLSREGSIAGQPRPKPAAAAKTSFPVASPANWVQNKAPPTRPAGRDVTTPRRSPSPAARSHSRHSPCSDAEGPNSQEGGDAGKFSNQPLFEGRDHCPLHS